MLYSLEYPKKISNGLSKGILKPNEKVQAYIIFIALPQMMSFCFFFYKKTRCSFTSKKTIQLVLLWYLFYCDGLEPNLQYLQGMLLTKPGIEKTVSNGFQTINGIDEIPDHLVTITSSSGKVRGIQNQIHPKLLTLSLMRLPGESISLPQIPKS